MYPINICVVFYRLIKAKSHDTTRDMERFTSINATKYNAVQIQSSVTYSASLPGQISCFQCCAGKKGFRDILPS